MTSRTVPPAGPEGARREFAITVVVPTCNRAAMLERTLASLLRQAAGGGTTFEVLVIDDGSSDHTAQVVAAVREAAGVPLRYVRQENRGGSAARNQGIHLARGEWLAFLDDDEEADPRWLAELWQTAQDSGALCVAGRVALRLPPATLARLGPRARRLLGETPMGLASPPSRDFMTSGNILLHRTVFENLGGFDERLRRDHDTDLFWRLELAGVPQASAAGALVYHVLPPARLEPGHLRKLSRLQGMADAGMLLKYAGWPGLAWAVGRRLAVVLLRDGLGGIMAAVGRDRRLLLESRLGLWYAQGLVRGLLFWTMPRLFPQSRFLKEVKMFSPQPGLGHLELRQQYLTTTPHV
jgi:glycosyltransferase involved in cell wall biosynthesis